MVDGALALVPAAKVGHVGIYRNKANSNSAREYYCKLPFDIKNREVIVLDLMLATGVPVVTHYQHNEHRYRANPFRYFDI